MCVCVCVRERERERGSLLATISNLAAPLHRLLSGPYTQGHKSLNCVVIKDPLTSELRVAWRVQL